MKRLLSLGLAAALFFASCATLGGFTAPAAPSPHDAGAHSADPGAHNADAGTHSANAAAHHDATCSGTACEAPARANSCSPVAGHCAAFAVLLEADALERAAVSFIAFDRRPETWRRLFGEFDTPPPRV